MTDLKQFDTRPLANAGVEIELKDLRTGKGSGAFITVVGTDSDVFSELIVTRSRTMADAITRNGGKPLERKLLDELTAETLAGCTLGWRPMTLGGEGFPFSYDNAKYLYANFPAIREQINTEIADRSNFIKA